MPPTKLNRLLSIRAIKKVIQLPDAVVAKCPMNSILEIIICFTVLIALINLEATPLEEIFHVSKNVKPVVVHKLVSILPEVLIGRFSLSGEEILEIVDILSKEAVESTYVDGCKNKQKQHHKEQFDNGDHKIQPHSHDPSDHLVEYV